MTEKKTRRGHVEQSNEAAEAFNRSAKFNQAFSHEPPEALQEDHNHSEGDSLLHHYSDDDK
ncbi:hypothetical protein GLW04_17465 [Halobacillus litoralis]|uniref:Uncharacterized protein n=1 Tax=Halobacillus litoralis TaxID=45668 RepID=A0A845DW02_9BACI|nr:MULTISPECIES: hypothetical protein [Halobacillus]MYL21690.1 hypothetical protein [Halobacillus litoralis]MYL31739.1 hypothetical protein [Halobacillus halophilus]MYL39900.1 hypothetical protein [Halobacillus litoralis]